MSFVQEMLQRKREPLDKWSVREQLCLASAVSRSGDQNWMSVSRALKPFGDSNRPSDWFHQKNCAAQYGALLENVETPKRKKRMSGQEVGIETPAESILRKLTAERKAELKKLLEEERAEFKKLQEEMALLQSGTVTEEQLDQWCKEIDEEEKQKEQETLAHSQWLKEREVRKQELERAWRPVVQLRQNQTITGQKRKASESIDQVESIEEDSNTQPQEQNTKPPISPLLTSLLKSPSHAQNIVTSSILHSAITNQRTNSISNPTITSLLNASTASVTVSPGLQQLVTSAISSAANQQNTGLLNQTNQGLNQNLAFNQVTHDILDDALPHLKVEDLERTILSSNDPLPEIKNEEVEVIISDLIENAADIVADPENHLQLDGSDDIISSFENELDELVNKENAAKEEAERLEKEKRQQEELRKEKEKIAIEKARFEQLEKLRLERQKMEESMVKVTTRLHDKTEAESSLKSLSESLKKSEVAEKKLEKTDPFEFDEDEPVVIPHKPPSSSLVKASVEVKSVEVGAVDMRNELVSVLDSEEDSQDVKKGSVEIVEVVVLEDEESDKELDKAQIQDIVHSSNVQVKDEPTTDSEELEELAVDGSTDSKSEMDVQSSEKEPSVFDEQADSIEMEIKTEVPDKKEEEESDTQRPTFTPEYSDDIFDDLSISVTKLDKQGKAKRDYTRKNKKEEKDIHLILATAEQTDSGDLDITETLSEKEFLDDKKDIKTKIKQESERSSSPWTEEEEPLTKGLGRRYSTPATPIDSIPNSPASGIAGEDDRDYRNWKKSVMLVYSRLATHKYASLFLKPITNEQAPGYHEIVYRPMDLQTIRKNVENGLIRSTAEFQRDVLLMFNNAIMYNKTDDHIYNMARQMQQESLQQIQILLQVNNIPNRRETRTSEPGLKRKRGEESGRGKKKRDD